MSKIKLWFYYMNPSLVKIRPKWKICQYLFSLFFLAFPKFLLWQDILVISFFFSFFPLSFLQYIFISFIWSLIHSIYLIIHSCTLYSSIWSFSHSLTRHLVSFVLPSPFPLFIHASIHICLFIHLFIFTLNFSAFIHM